MHGLVASSKPYSHEHLIVKIEIYLDHKRGKFIENLVKISSICFTVLVPKKCRLQTGRTVAVI